MIDMQFLLASIPKRKFQFTSQFQSTNGSNCVFDQILIHTWFNARVQVPARYQSKQIYIPRLTYFVYGSGFPQA